MVVISGFSEQPELPRDLSAKTGLDRGQPYRQQVTPRLIRGRGWLCRKYYAVGLVYGVGIS